MDYHFEISDLDYSDIYKKVFRNDYPGYNPNLKESPNGDNQWDGDKKYAHIAEKYLTSEVPKEDVDYLSRLLEDINDIGIFIATSLGVPPEFWPTTQYSAIRVLEYPPKADSYRHTDFSLFSIVLYRNLWDNLLVEDPDRVKNYTHWENFKLFSRRFQGIQFGEILELLLPNRFCATPHRVIADPYDRTQSSIVYFAMPDFDSLLPNSQKVGQFVDERISRSRKVVS